jgi:hypothetical protein
MHSLIGGLLLLLANESRRGSHVISTSPQISEHFRRQHASSEHIKFTKDQLISFGALTAIIVIQQDCPHFSEFTTPLPSTMTFPTTYHLPHNSHFHPAPSKTDAPKSKSHLTPWNRGLPSIRREVPSSRHHPRGSHAGDPLPPSGRQANESSKEGQWWHVQPFQGMINDVRRRMPYYWSDYRDAWDYRVVPATGELSSSEQIEWALIRGTVYMYFAKWVEVSWSLCYHEDLLTDCGQHTTGFGILVGYVSFYLKKGSRSSWKIQVLENRNVLWSQRGLASFSLGICCLCSLCMPAAGHCGRHRSHYGIQLVSQLVREIGWTLTRYSTVYDIITPTGTNYLAFTCWIGLYARGLSSSLLCH